MLVLIFLTCDLDERNIVSNPLDQQISDLIREIGALEAERDRIVQQLMELRAYPISELRPEVFQKLRPLIESAERLDRNIDSKRQKLISLELFKLDDSIKSLETTTDKLLKSSTKLERLTTILLWATLFIGLAAVLQVSVAIYQISAIAGFIGTSSTLVGLVVLGILVRPVLRRLSRG